MNHTGVSDTSVSLQGALPQVLFLCPSLLLLGKAIFQRAIRPQPHRTL